MELPFITSNIPHATDAALFLNRLLVGVFFILARFRWVYDPQRPTDPWFNYQRHQSLIHKMGYCGFGERYWLAWFVACVELSAALGLIVGLFTSLAALGLIFILIFATICTGKEKTLRQNPVDCLDVCSCYLWCPEPVYLVLTVSVFLMGAGAWSLDGFLKGLLQ